MILVLYKLLVLLSLLFKLALLIPGLTGLDIVFVTNNYFLLMENLLKILMENYFQYIKMKIKFWKKTILWQKHMMVIDIAYFVWTKSQNPEEQQVNPFI